MIFLDSQQASKILRAMKAGKERVRVSLDLYLSFQEVRIERDRLILEGRVLSRETLEKMAKKRNSVFKIDSGVEELKTFKGHFYRLVSVVGHGPTLEIDGIRMHQTKLLGPEESAERKIRALGIRKCFRVLDVCTGLGYTAFYALKYGACEVVSIEKDVQVIEFAKLNPWTSSIFENKGFNLLIGDAYELVDGLSPGFDAIVHDPPRFALAGHLYSESFYRKLFALLAENGLLIHYVGMPGHKRGKRIWVGVGRRLKRVGFSILRFIPEIKCFLCSKEG